MGCKSKHTHRSLLAQETAEQYPDGLGENASSPTSGRRKYIRPIAKKDNWDPTKGEQVNAHHEHLLPQHPRLCTFLPLFEGVDCQYYAFRSKGMTVELTISRHEGIFLHNRRLSAMGCRKVLGGMGSSSMKTYIHFLAFCASMVLFASCTDGGEIVSPPTIDWEGNAPLFNEAYRDSIVAIKGGGEVSLWFKDGTEGRVVGRWSEARSVSWSPRKWKILCATSHGLFFMNPDGSNQKPVTPSREYFLDAKMSPDAQKIAYISIDTTDAYRNKGKIKVMDPDGTHMRELTSRIVGPNSVSWTPDSKYIIYSSQDRSDGGINIISPEGTGHRILYPDSGSSCDFPSLSPDGTQLAFSTSVRGVDLTFKIYLLDMATLKRSKALTTGTSQDFQPTWSTNGQQIVFCSSIGSSTQLLWRIDRDGQHLVCLTPTSQIPISSPSWCK